MSTLRLSDRVACQLLELVQERQLQPGARLPTERALAEQMGVSRTALREAIHATGYEVKSVTSAPYEKHGLFGRRK